MRLDLVLIRMDHSVRLIVLLKEKDLIMDSPIIVFTIVLPAS